MKSIIIATIILGATALASFGPVPAPSKVVPWNTFKASVAYPAVQDELKEYGVTLVVTRPTCPNCAWGAHIERLK
jgi:hypothetical protein